MIHIPFSYQSSLMVKWKLIPNENYASYKMEYEAFKWEIKNATSSDAENNLKDFTKLLKKQ